MGYGTGPLGELTMHWHWFSWFLVGEVKVIQPKAGPFDPRTDEARTSTKCKYICAKCGAVKLKAEDWGYPY